MKNYDVRLSMEGHTFSVIITLNAESAEEAENKVKSLMRLNTKEN